MNADSWSQSQKAYSLGNTLREPHTHTHTHRERKRERESSQQWRWLNSHQL